MNKYGLQYGIVTSSEERERAANLEQAVWDENDYGNLEEEGYTTYFPNSQVIAAFDQEECIGMTRMFRNTIEQPPFIGSMPFYDEAERTRLEDLYLRRY